MMKETFDDRNHIGEMDAIEGPAQEKQSMLKSYLLSSTRTKVTYMLLFFPLVLFAQMKMSIALSSSQSSQTRNLVDFPLAGAFEPSAVKGDKLNQRGPCLNDDYEPSSDIAVVTLGLRKTYLDTTVLLAASIKQHATIKTDLVLMELKSKPLPPKSWADLKKVGWKKCIVERIDPLPSNTADDTTTTSTTSSSSHFDVGYSKLNIWKMTQYKAAVYMNPDTLVVGNLNDLLSLSMFGTGIAATADFNPTEQTWSHDSFNIGVFKVIPSNNVFDRLMTLRDSNAPDDESGNVPSDQEWLNKAFKRKWKEIGIDNNADLAALNTMEKNLDAIVNVIHFTDPKPWSCPTDTAKNGDGGIISTTLPVEKYCKLWHDSWNIHLKLSLLRKSNK